MCGDDIECRNKPVCDINNKGAYNIESMSSLTSSDQLLINHNKNG